MKSDTPSPLDPTDAQIAPPPPNELADETLLCERCGYVLEGLDGDGPCPECGLAIRESLPEARPGSPWQVRPGVRAWGRTNLGTLLRARERFRRAKGKTTRSHGLLWMNLILAGALLAAPWTGTLVGDPARTYRNQGWMGDAALLVSMVVQPAIGAGALWLLTYIEYLGIRFFARRRRWRLSKAAAWQVCAHASVGWIVMAALPFVVLAGFYSAQRFFDAVPNGTIGAGSAFGPISVNHVVTGGALGLSYLGGMMVFETLVYVGVRQCRFANGPGARVNRAAAFA